MLHAAGKLCPLAVVVTDGGKDECDWCSEILLSAVLESTCSSAHSCKVATVVFKVQEP